MQYAIRSPEHPPKPVPNRRKHPVANSDAPIEAQFAQLQSLPYLVRPDMHTAGRWHTSTPEAVIDIGDAAYVQNCIDDAAASLVS